MDTVVDHGHAVIEQGSKSFAAAAKLFDPATRARAVMLYAWCRHCDDETDDQVLGFKAPQPANGEGRARVERLRRRREAFGCFVGKEIGRKNWIEAISHSSPTCSATGSACSR